MKTATQKIFDIIIKDWPDATCFEDLHEVCDPNTYFEKPFNEKGIEYTNQLLRDVDRLLRENATASPRGLL